MLNLTQRSTINNARDKTQAIVLFLFLFPLFFQLTGSIFASTDFFYESHGDLLRIPIPLAAVICFVGITLLLRLEKHHFGMEIIFFVFILMIASTFFSSVGMTKVGLTKFILLVQFIFPLFALVFGGLYLEPESEYISFEAIALYVLSIVIPLEVISTIVQGTGALYPKLFIFSLYQHLEYLPTIFIGLFFLSVTYCYKKENLRNLALFLTPWVGVYFAASLSVFTIILTAFSTIFIVFLLNKEYERRYVLLCIILLLLPFIMYLCLIEKTDVPLQQSENIFVIDDAAQDEMPKNPVVYNSIDNRIFYWRIHGEKIFETPQSFLFGHDSRLDRLKYPSAYNYYVDLIYNFGALPLLPILYLIFITIRNSKNIFHAKLLTPQLMMLLFLVFFFVCIDNAFKVGFRQPYSGMVMFFLWGKLLMQISSLGSTQRTEINGFN